MTDVVTVVEPTRQMPSVPKAQEGPVTPPPAPPEDDPPAGNLPALPKPPPTPPTGENSHNPLVTNALQCNDDPPETMGVTYYGYRYYDPVTGRWPSRDPIAPNFFTGEFNDYAFIKNLGLNAIDYVGLTVITGSADKAVGNCLGGAVMNDGSVYLAPNHKLEKDQSFREALEKSFGLKCTEHAQARDCNCKCNEEKILITLYKNDDPTNQGKNPWNDPEFEWNFDKKEKPLSDIHAIRADKGCSKDYKQIPQFQPGIPGQGGFNKNIDWDLFKDKPLLCCCYKKK